MVNANMTIEQAIDVCIQIRDSITGDTHMDRLIKREALAMLINIAEEQATKDSLSKKE